MITSNDPMIDVGTEMPLNQLESNMTSKTTVVAVTCSGTPSDYTAAKLDDVCAKIAQAGGLDPSAASCTVQAASVIITATLTVPPGTTVQSVVDALSTAIADPTLASSLLGVSMESTPTFSDASDATRSSTTTIMAIALATSGVIAVGLGLALLWCTARKRTIVQKKQVAFTSSRPLRTIPTEGTPVEEPPSTKQDIETHKSFSSDI